MSPSTIKDHRAQADLTLNLGPECDVVPSGQLISAEALHGELRMAAMLAMMIWKPLTRLFWMGLPKFLH